MYFKESEMKSSSVVRVVLPPWLHTDKGDIKGQDFDNDIAASARQVSCWNRHHEQHLEYKKAVKLG